MSDVWVAFRIFELRYCIIDHWVRRQRVCKIVWVDTGAKSMITEDRK